MRTLAQPESTTCVFVCYTHIVNFPRGVCNISVVVVGVAIAIVDVCANVAGAVLAHQAATTHNAANVERYHREPKRYCLWGDGSRTSSTPSSSLLMNWPNGYWKTKFEKPPRMCFGCVLCQRVCECVGHALAAVSGTAQSRPNMCTCTTRFSLRAIQSALNRAYVLDARSAIQTNVLCITSALQPSREGRYARVCLCVWNWGFVWIGWIIVHAMRRA